jgi:hypothetical protein
MAREEGIVRALGPCACQESSSKTPRYECCSAQVAFAPFHPKYAAGADLSIGMRRIPITGHH